VNLGFDNTMLILKVRHATMARDQLAMFEKLVDAAPPSFRRVIKPALSAQAAVLNLVPEELRQSRGKNIAGAELSGRNTMVDGEVLTDGSRLLAMSVKLPSSRARLVSRSRLLVEATDSSEHILEIAYIGDDPSCPELDEMGKAVSTILGVELREHRYPSLRFDELKSEGRESPVPPTEEELVGALLLKSRAARTIAVAIKASGGLLVRDLARQLPSASQEVPTEIAAALASAGLVDSEIVVICGKSQSQTARVPSRELIETLSKQGLKCACGRPIGEERVEEALTITDLGRSLLDKSRWLSILLIEELGAVGVPREDTLIDQQLGGDEIDCLANISGEVALFELKDKEFSLGNAYSFGAKIGIVRPEHSIIASTDRVGNDAKDHFHRARLAGRADRFVEGEGSEVRYIEGVDNLSAGVRELAGSIYQSDIRRLLDEILRFGVIDARVVMQSVENDAPLLALAPVLAPADVIASPAAGVRLPNQPSLPRSIDVRATEEVAGPSA
jgi:hypothetical protein